MATDRLPLNREEWVEQTYFFRVLRERLETDTPIQEVLSTVREEILATTKLPFAIDFLLGELHHHGKLGHGMTRLSHYFTPFQAFLVSRAEAENAQLDFRIALEILEKEAQFRSGAEGIDPAALFIFQFECIARNRLGYDEGMLVISRDPVYPEEWKQWILQIRFALGTVDFADLLYVRSEQYLIDKRTEPDQRTPILFTAQAGKIARANRGKDPLYMFAALQRHLGYPAVPRPKRKQTKILLEPPVEARFQRLEARIALVEQELKGGIDLSTFYRTENDSFTDEPQRPPAND